MEDCFTGTPIPVSSGHGTCKVPVEVRFLIAVAPRALKVGNRRESSAAIEGLDDGTKEVEALLVAVNAATFLISLL